MESVPLKQCSKKEHCEHPKGPWLPDTFEYFPKKRGKTAARCKICTYAYQNQWAKNNPEKILANSRRYEQRHYEARRVRYKPYRDANRDAINVRTRARYNANIEKQREYRRQWRLNNPGKQAVYSARWRSKKPEVQLRATTAWRKAHPDYASDWKSRNKLKVRTYDQKRRYLLRSLGSSFTDDELRIQLEMQKHLCWWCGMSLTDEYHIDHRIPLSRGGSNLASNICISCPACNLSKGSKMPHEWSGRLL